MSSLVSGARVRERVAEASWLEYGLAEVLPAGAELPANVLPVSCSAGRKLSWGERPFKRLLQTSGPKPLGLQIGVPS